MEDHEVCLVDMFMGDQVDYETKVDLVAITVRTLLAVIAYEIADNFLKRGKIGDLCITPTFAWFWSLRRAKRRGNLLAYQCVMRLLRFARNDNTVVMQSCLKSLCRIYYYSPVILEKVINPSGGAVIIGVLVVASPGM